MRFFFFQRQWFLILIILLAFIFRFNHLNWDKNQHLHPDERFLTMVNLKMKVPRHLIEFYNQSKSSLNPFNLGEKFFVYGSWPLIINKIISISLDGDNYNFLTLNGRFLSAFFDFVIVILVYKTGKLLLEMLKKFQHDDKKNNTKKIIFDYFPLFAAFFYAISVYPIQSSHFFTTDTFLNFFMFASFYLILRFYVFGSFFWLFLSAVFFGIALACKVSALYILPLNLGVIFFKELLFNKKNEKINLVIFFTRYTFHVLRYTIIFYFSLRLFNPYYFASSNFFDWRLNQDFITSISLLKILSKSGVWYPPAVQWINKPWWGLLSTTFFVGLGPVNFLVMLIGLVYLIFNFQFLIFKQFLNFKKNKKIKKEFFLLMLIVFWVVGYFVYQSLEFVKSIRYTIYLYPFYAIFGGIGLTVISSQLNRLNRFNQLHWLKNVLHFTLYVIFLFWPILFSTIYFHKNTRVEASEWVYEKLPNQSIILGEYWDDPLPLYIEQNYGKTFQIELLPVFDPDTEEKWQRMKNLLSKANYYVLSSNRGWGSITTVPERYPIMSQYYQALLKNDCQTQIKISGVCYKRIKEFLPYYYKFIHYPDSWIEETFTVYDHPIVLIYEKIKK